MSKISSNLLKLGRKTAEDISLTIDNGTANLPEIKYDNAAGNFKFSNDGTNFFDFGSGSGSGEINYVENWDFETDTSGWATYADAAGTTPVDGDGGSANVAISSQAITVLRGGKSLKLVKDAADRQGEGFSYDFAIKEQDIQKKLKIQFDFKTDEDVAYASGDLTVYIYDVTNATLITPVDTDIIAGQNIFQTSFVSTGSTSYRLIFHIATTNASAWDAYIDNVIVGPGMTSQGAAIGPWTSYTPTIQGFGSFSSDLYYRRVGDSIEISGDVTTGTTSADELQIGLPSGLTLGGPSGATIAYGRFHRDASVGMLEHHLRGVAGETYFTAVESFDGGTVNVLTATGSNGSSIVASSQRISIQILGVPITQFAGKGIVPMLSEDNLSEWTGYTPVLVGFGSATGLNLEYRRVGDSIEIRGDFISGNSTAVEAQLPLPLGLTVGGVSTAAIRAGGYSKNVTSATGIGFILATKDDVFLNFTTYDNRDSFPVDTLSPNDGDEMISSGQRLSLLSTAVPIQEWAGSQNSLVGYSEASSSLLGLVKKPGSMVRCNTGNASPNQHGTTNTIIRHFANSSTTGSDITYAATNADGSSFTINADGVYAISYSDLVTASSGVIGISLNSSQLTTSINSITTADRLCSEAIGTSTQNISATVILSVGDVIRPHTDGFGNESETDRVDFIITQVAKL